MQFLSLKDVFYKFSQNKELWNLKPIQSQKNMNKETNELVTFFMCLSTSKAENRDNP